MRQIEAILGNSRTDSELAARVDSHREKGTLETVRIAASERKKSRLRVETTAGTDLGLVPDRPLQAGDVLVLDDERAIVVEFERREAAVIDLPEPTPELLEVAVELGHRVGNQHWELATHDGSVYIPVAADKHIIENVLEDSLPAGCTIRYEEVDADRWIDDEGTEKPAYEHVDHAGHDHGPGGHTHGSGDGHAHTNGNHDHTHGTGHDHTHADHSETMSGDQA